MSAGTEVLVLRVGECTVPQAFASFMPALIGLEKCQWILELRLYFEIHICSLALVLTAGVVGMLSGCSNGECRRDGQTNEANMSLNICAIKVNI